MSNMSAMDGDNDMVSEPVTIVVVAEAVNESNNVSTSLTTQQSNTTMWKKDMILMVPPQNEPQIC